MNDKNNLPVVASTPGVPALEQWYEAEPGQQGPSTDPMALARRIMSALLRHKWLIAGLVVLGTAGAVVGMRFVKFRYAAEATFWFDVPNRNDQMRGPIVASGLLEDDAWAELLRSYAVLDYVVIEERLYLEHGDQDKSLFAAFRIDSIFRPGEYAFVVSADGRSADLQTGQGLSIERVEAGAPAGAQLGLIWRPDASEFEPKRKVSFRVLAPRDAAKELNDKLVTRMARGGNFLRISYSGTDRELAASVVNTLGRRYVEVAAELKRFRSTELRDALEQQLITAQVNLAESEMRLESFRVQTATLPSESSTLQAPGLESTRAPAMNAFFTLRLEREDLQRDRQALARIIDAEAGTDSLSVDAISAVGAVQRTPELQRALQELTEKRAELRALRQQFTDEHATVRRATSDVRVLESAVVPQLARRVMANLDSRGQVLDDLIASAGTELQAIPPRAIEEARHRRAVEISATMYNDLRQRYEGARLASETAVPDVRIHDRATVPTRPISDPRITLLLFGIFGSFGLGAGIAILLDRIDPRLRYAEQVTNEMGLSVVGAVPYLTGARRGQIGSDESARVLEALRAIRLNLMHAHGSAGPIMVTITSPGSGDGKTFISSNLALTFADLGMKTLVVDGDTRRGGLHHLYGLTRKPGLTDYLAGDIELEGLVKPTRYPLVSVITGGTRRSDSPELLSSPRLGDLLAAIRNEFQVIIVDSPPLGAGIDPLVLASLTGNMVLVMRTGKTERAMAEAKLAILDRMPIRLLGVILNGLDDTTSYRYYSYLPGYEAGLEDAEEELEAEAEQKALQPA
jgi:polysaccharide biosynthesis transport protein